jgi:hypothetical protein
MRFRYLACFSACVQRLHINAHVPRGALWLLAEAARERKKLEQLIRMLRRMAGFELARQKWGSLRVAIASTNILLNYRRDQIEMC